MKIIIKGADFKDNNLESTTISKYYSVTYSGSGVSSSSAPKTIAYGDDNYAVQDLVATIKVLSSYTFNSVTSVSVGGKALSTSDYTVSGQIVTVPANKITGNVVITVATEKVNTEPEEPGTGGGSGDNTGGTVIMIQMTPSDIQTGKLTNKETGVIESSGSGYFHEFNIDSSMELYATGYSNSATAKGAGVTYFSADGTYLGKDELNGILASNFEDVLLTIPTNAARVRVASTSGANYNAVSLKRKVIGEWVEITKISTTSSSITNKDTGAIETSTSGSFDTFMIDDVNAIYCASGYAPKNTGTSAGVTYFDSSDSYIGYDATIASLSSQAYTYVTLTIPNNTYKIRVQSSSTIPKALYKLIEG